MPLASIGFSSTYIGGVIFYRNATYESYDAFITPMGSSFITCKFTATSTYAAPIF